MGGWSGAVLAVLIAVIFTFITKEESKVESLVRSQPEVGDVIFIYDADQRETPYYFIKVKSLQGYNIMFFQSRYSYSHISSAKKAVNRKRHEDLYYEEDVQFSREYIEKSKEVRGAIRPTTVPASHNNRGRLSKDIKRATS